MHVCKLLRSDKRFYFQVAPSTRKSVTKYASYTYINIFSNGLRIFSRNKVTLDINNKLKYPYGINPDIPTRIRNNRTLWI